MFVAGSAALLFLIALNFLNRKKALLIALAYGLGTCVWSISSQTLYQHGPNEFFIALGTYFLLMIDNKKYSAALCAAAYSIALICRPTSAVLVIAAGIYLLVKKPRLFVIYVISGLPFAFALGYYNYYYMGSPFSSAKIEVSLPLSEKKTGVRDVWQTPYHKGACGLFFSPSRGLFIYSPFLLFALFGISFSFRKNTHFLFPLLAIALFFLLSIAFKWYDWWGGWSYGYRPIVDTMPLLAILMIPAMDWLCNQKWLVGLFLILLAWSIFVQIIGAFAYNLSGWNQKTTVELGIEGKANNMVTSDLAFVQTIIDKGKGRIVRQYNQDIDFPQHRKRLWSIKDNQIFYYMQRFEKSRILKKRMMGLSLKAQ